MKALHINGNDLTLEAVREVAVERRAVLLRPRRARGCRPGARGGGCAGRGKPRFLRHHHRRGQTGGRPHCGRADSRAASQSGALPRRGCGRTALRAETRAMMLLRANSLSKGHSGVRGAVIDTICEMLNRGVTPMVPSQGSVGASGDLAPLAHLALALIGEGECLGREGRADSRRRRHAARPSQAAGARSQRSRLSDQRDAGHAGGGNPGAAGGRDPGRYR